jgi:hypothetical protein
MSFLQLTSNLKNITQYILDNSLKPLKNKSKGVEILSVLAKTISYG